MKRGEDAEKEKKRERERGRGGPRDKREEFDVRESINLPDTRDHEARPDMPSSDEKGIAVSRYRTTCFCFLLPAIASILRTLYMKGDHCN